MSYMNELPFASSYGVSLNLSPFNGLILTYPLARDTTLHNDNSAFGILSIEQMADTKANKKYISSSSSTLPRTVSKNDAYSKGISSRTAEHVLVQRFMKFRSDGIVDLEMEPEKKISYEKRTFCSWIILLNPAC